MWGGWVQQLIMRMMTINYIYNAVADDDKWMLTDEYLYVFTYVCMSIFMYVCWCVCMLSYLYSSMYLGLYKWMQSRTLLESTRAYLSSFFSADENFQIRRNLIGYSYAKSQRGASQEESPTLSLQEGRKMINDQLTSRNIDDGRHWSRWTTIKKDRQFDA